MNKFILGITILLFFDNNLMSQSFEKMIPNIYIQNSCSKQAHIGIEFQNTFSGFDEIKDSLIVIWKKDGQIIKTSKKKDLYITELGKYSCDVQNLNSKINSNLLEIKEFTNTKLIMYKFPAPPQIKFFRDVCSENEYYKEMASNLNGYYFAGAYKYLTAKALAELKSDTKFNWFVNDKLNNLANGGPDLSSENHEINIRLLVTDGQCDFISNNTQVYNYAIPKKGIKKYEFCPGDTTNITMKSGFNSDSRKFIWYKDGEIFSEEIEEPKLSIDEEMYPNRRLRTTLPGKYILKTLYLNTSGIGNDKFDENSCSFWSDSIEVVFKNEILLRKSNYISEMFESEDRPDYRKLQTKLCGEIPIAILTTDSLTQNFEWYKNGIAIPKSVYGNTTIEKNFTGYFKSNNLYFNTLPIELQSEYFAKIHIKPNCVAVTDTILIQKNKSFKIQNLSVCNDFNFNIVNLNKGSDVDYSYAFKYKIDGNIVERNDLIKYNDGNFQVIAQKGDCILESNILPIHKPQINLSLNITDSLHLCEGKIAKIVLADTTPNITYLGLNKDGLIINQGESQLGISKNGNYQILFKDNICNNYYYSNPVKVIETPLPTASISGGKTINYNESTNLQLDFTSLPPWEVKLNSGEEFIAEKTPFYLKVNPLKDTKYWVESVKNSCGIGKSDGEALVKVIILANEPNSKSDFELKTYPIPVADVFEVEVKNSVKSYVTLYLYTQTGQKIESFSIEKKQNEFKKSLNIGQLPAGVYILKTEIDGKYIIKKIIKN